MSGAERRVWELLRSQLRKNDVLLANLRVTDRKKDYEADLVVLMPDAGAVVVEIKGGSVWRDAGRWRTSRQGSEVTIDPVGQARDARYALRTYVESDSRWTARRQKPGALGPRRGVAQHRAPRRLLLP